MKTERTTAQSIIRVLIVTAIVLVIPLVANQFIEGEGWSLFDFAFMGALIVGTGLLYELAVKRPGSRTSAVVAAVIAAIGGAAVVFGEVDDAPGLVLFGFVLVTIAVVLGIRTVRRGPGANEEPTGPAGSA